MFRKLTVLLCLLSFTPVAAGAQELALLANAPPALERTTEAPARELNLMPSEATNDRILVAASHLSGEKMAAAEEQRPRRSHQGMTFKEFAEVHFGEYRWIYWVGAVAAIVALHVVVAD